MLLPRLIQDMNQYTFALEQDSSDSQISIPAHTADHRPPINNTTITRGSITVNFKTTSHDACLRSIHELVFELATELDLHYENEDFHALSGSIEKMKRGMLVLRSEGMHVPEEAHHVVNRYMGSLG